MLTGEYRNLKNEVEKASYLGKNKKYQLIMNLIEKIGIERVDFQMCSSAKDIRLRFDDGLATMRLPFNEASLEKRLADKPIEKNAEKMAENFRQINQD